MHTHAATGSRLLLVLIATAVYLVAEVAGGLLTAALVNSRVLIGIAVSILVAAWDRFREPQPVDALPMLLVGAGGLVVTLVGVWLLHSEAQQNLNVRGAFLEVLGDLLGALGTVLAAGVILTTGWTQADPLISA